jgi:hypothetical protein
MKVSIRKAQPTCNKLNRISNLKISFLTTEAKLASKVFYMAAKAPWDTI